VATVVIEVGAVVAAFLGGVWGVVVV
jgi:hypothetical protein